MNAAAPHRATLTVLVGLAAAAVVAGARRPVADARRPHAAPARDAHHRHRPRLRRPSASSSSPCGASRRRSRAVRTRARRAALAATVHGELSCGIRSRLLVAAPERSRRTPIAPCASVPAMRSWSTSSASPSGTAGAGPDARRSSRGARCATSAPTRWWSAERSFPSSSCACGTTARASSCPSSCRRDAPSRFALADAPFFAVIRSPGRPSTVRHSPPRASSCRRSPPRSRSSRHAWRPPPGADATAIRLVPVASGLSTARHPASALIQTPIRRRVESLCAHLPHRESQERRVRHARASFGERGTRQHRASSTAMTPCRARSSWPPATASRRTSTSTPPEGDSPGDGRARGDPGVRSVAGLEADELRTTFGFVHGNAVAEHLFAVASGLESVVVGEGEIAGQVRRSLERARVEGTTTPSSSASSSAPRRRRGG